MRSLGGVGIAVLAQSALGYVLLVACGRLLSPTDYGLFLVFWGVLFGLGGSLSPLEQDVARQSSEAAVSGSRPGPAIVQVMAIGAAVVILIGALSLLTPLPDRLFGGQPVLLWVAMAGCVGLAVEFTVRGLYVGSGRIGPYSGMLVTEAGIRLALLGALAMAGRADSVALAVAVAAGSFAWVLFGLGARPLVRFDGPREPWGNAGSRVVALMAASGLMSVVITGYPAIVGAFARPAARAELGVLFAALTVSRLPLLFLVPVQALTVPAVVRLSQDERGRRRLRRLLTVLVLGTAMVGALGALIGALLGPSAVTLLYGVDYQPGRSVVAALVWSSVVLGAVHLLSAVLVARAQAARVMITWAAVAALSVVLLAWVPGDLIHRAVLSIAVSPTVGMVLATVFVFVTRTRAAVRRSRSNRSDRTSIGH